MKQKVLNVFKPIIFLVVGIVLFFCVQNIMVLDNENMERAFNGFDALEPDSLDVLVLGASTTQYGVLPMELYKNYGIKSYSLTSAGQPTECSYFLAQYAFETQSPKVVILDAAPIMDSDDKFPDGKRNAFWWSIFNQLPMGRVKWEMAQAYDQMSYSDGAASVIFPILKYHTRWKELTIADFIWQKKELHYAGGALINPSLAGTAVSKEFALYEENEALARNEGYIAAYDQELTETKTIDEPIYAPVLTEEKQEYLLKLKRLCEENGAQLILFKVPSYYFIYYDPWTSVKSNLLKEFAAENNIPFYDYSLDYDLVDLSTDFVDWGIHVNAGGGLKVSAAVGALLADTYGCLPNPDSQYDSMLANYDKVIDAASLEMEIDFYKYIERLAVKKSDYTIYISAANEYMQSMTPEDYAFLEEKLGLRLVSQGGYADSYLAVIDSGELLYEAVSNRRIDHDMTVNDQSVTLASCGWFSGTEASIIINENDYAQNDRGLNFVIVDKESGVVVDSVVFDTHEVSKQASRNWDATYDYLRAYEQKMCF